ncbi:MAG: hypothetical protein JNL01_12665 [Bdellovibrionales bacterium]|nr:hypothetical protein [Bdellovibrionales bacterium]
MNGAHFHLVVNHISLFSLLFGIVAYGLSLRKKSADLRTLAVGLFVLTGVFAVVAFESGEKAEDFLKTLGGGFESFVEPHEQAAVWALRSGILIALLSVAYEWAVRSKKKAAKVLQWALLVFAIHGFTVFSVTAFLGGKVRHTEAR